MRSMENSSRQEIVKTVKEKDKPGPKPKGWQQYTVQLEPLEAERAKDSALGLAGTLRLALREYHEKLDKLEKVKK